MPELPEVQTIVSDLLAVLPGKKITSARYIGPLGEELRRKSKIDLSLTLAGKEITGSRRIAKQIILDLDSGDVLSFHLKITGRLLFRDCADPEDENLRLLIELDGSKALRFTDKNGLADANLLTQSELEAQLKKYGPEVIDKTLTAAEFHRLVASSKEPSLKETLLNQGVVSGMGNIYVDEALNLAKLHPNLRPSQITQAESEKLLTASRQVLAEGLRDRGTTIDSYLDAYGRPGKHQDNLRVYGRTGKSCPNCQGTIEYKEVGGRRTFFCPSCQKLPQLSLF
jgi:formamidopyrimidine-DNA glycosylase